MAVIDITYRRESTLVRPCPARAGGWRCALGLHGGQDNGEYTVTLTGSIQRLTQLAKNLPSKNLQTSGGQKQNKKIIRKTKRVRAESFWTASMTRKALATNPACQEADRRAPTSWSVLNEQVDEEKACHFDTAQLESYKKQS